jgi:hypothetical protein
MVTKYLACDPKVGSDANTGDNEQVPWLTLQISIDKMVAARKDPAETLTLMIMNYEVLETAHLKGASYSNFAFIGTINASASNDPHQDVLFCEPRPRMKSLDPDKPIFLIEDADDITIENLVLHDSHRGVEAHNAKNVQIVKCCIHHNKTKRGAGFLLEACTAPVVDTCRVWANEATDDDGGAGAFDRCKGGTVKKSFFFLNKAKRTGGALSLRVCTDEFAIDENAFGGTKIDHNDAERGGAVAARRCDKVAFGLATGPNTHAYNAATSRGGALWLELCRQVLVQRDAFFHNHAQQEGGVVWSAGTDLTLHEAQLHDNSAGGSAGAIHAEDALDAAKTWVQGALTLRLCRVRKNAAQATPGLFAFGVPVTIEGSRFDEHAGGDATMHVLGDGRSGKAKLELSGTTFQDNQAGAAVLDATAYEPTVIVKCTFEDNTATSILSYLQFDKGHKLELRDCRFVSNQGLRAAYIGQAWTGSIQGNRVRGNAGDGFLASFCDLRALGMKRNEFAGNKGTDIEVNNDLSAQPMTATELEQANTVFGLVPSVLIK